jgi:hypothetical protein
MLERHIPIRALFTVVVSAGAALLSGCGGLERHPLAPDRIATAEKTSRTGKVAGIPPTVFKPVSFRLSSLNNLQAAKLAPVIVQKWISAEQGGQLLLDWEAKDENGVTGSKVKVEVKILPGALERDAMISIRLANPAYAMVTVDLAFGTHGTRFRMPAEVKLDLQGLDLSGYKSADAIDLFWYDPSSQSWFPVPKVYKQVELTQGKVQGIWLFEHFSTYSLGGDELFPPEGDDPGDP